MAQCVSFVAATSQSGTYVVQALPDAPESCSAFLVLDVNDMTSLQPVFPPLTTAQGAAIASAILGVWAVAWAMKQLIAVFRR